MRHILKSGELLEGGEHVIRKARQPYAIRNATCVARPLPDNPSRYNKAARIHALKMWAKGA
jgi:hypothetical protein